MKQIIAFFIILNFSVFNLTLGYAQCSGYSQVPAYLCEIGIEYYNQGNNKEALHEFNKALLAQPGYALALEYIERIKHGVPPSYQEEAKPVSKHISKKRIATVNEYLDSIEHKGLVVPAGPGITATQVPISSSGVESPKVSLLPQIVQLDENIKSLTKPLEIEQGKNLIVVGRNITRFLVVSPDIIEVKKLDFNELQLTGKDIGFTYLHVWDEQGRWTLQFLTVPAKPEGPTLEEIMRQGEEHAGTFRLRYSVDYDVYERGRRLNDMSRQSYAYNHLLGIDGASPYGNLYANLAVRSSALTTDLSYVNLSLTDGLFGPFKGFTIRALDYSPPISNLTFSSAYLRGAMLESPAFNKKVDYTVFWGREGGGRYGNLSPGLTKIKDSYLSGVDFSLRPTFKQMYGFSVIHGWGRDRPEDLNPYNFDMYTDLKPTDHYGMRYEIANDSQRFAHLFSNTFSIPKFRLAAEFRDIDKEFRSATAHGYREGQLGTLFTVLADPFEKLDVSGRLDIYRDRLFPNPENPDIWNEDLDLGVSYTIDPLTSLRLYYTLQNDLGRAGPFRYWSPGVGLNRTFELQSKKIYTFANFRHQDNEDFTNPTVNYTNEKLSFGLRTPVMGDLYYYANQDFNWLYEKDNNNLTRPQAFETGLDWTRQVFNSPFYGDFRIMYRDEENSESPLSFISGEDYLEGYGQISYRPNQDTEIYYSTRIRNVWADNPNVTKRVEAEFRSGLRHTWDTGLRWEAVGTIDGYVFKDLNGDGLISRDDPPVEGVKIWLGKDKFAITDLFGYFKFTKVKARNAFLSIETSTIPTGFMLTVPGMQEITVLNRQTSRAYFGIMSRSEIIGTIFEDVDGDGQLGLRDIGIGNIVLTLDGGRKIVTDSSGRYFIRNVSTGKHTLNMDLKSLPTKYIPSVSIFKEIELFEGVSFVHNIPVKKTE